MSLLPVLEEAMELDGDCDLRDQTAEEDLIRYAKEGNTCDAKNLLERGVSVDAKSYNKNLFYASKNYLTPLQWSSRRGHVECVKLFIEWGANVNSRDRFDVTSVHLVAECGSFDCLSALLDAGADCNVPTKYSKYGFYTAYPHAGGTTALHLAAKNNHIDCVKELIINGADYNAVDEHGRTSLYIAAEMGHEECLITQLQNAIGRDILSLPIKDTGDTPLHQCVCKGMLLGVKELLKHGSDVNLWSKKTGQSPLHLALYRREKNCFDIVQELVLHGYNTDVNSPDRNGLVPLQYVVFNEGRRPKVASFLIAYGAQFNTVIDRHGLTLLKREFMQMDKNNSILNAIVNSSLQLPSFEIVLGTGNVSPNNPQVLQEPVFRERSHVQQKQQWYQSLCTNPRTLQHICRCKIRETLGPKRLRNIDELTLPKSLKDYLLLNHNYHFLDFTLTS